MALHVRIFVAGANKVEGKSRRDFLKSFDQIFEETICVILRTNCKRDKVQLVVYHLQKDSGKSGCKVNGT